MSYEVVHEDLSAAGRTFHTEGDALDRLWRSPLGGASSGEAFCDHTISELMLAFDLLGTALGQAVGDHGDRLKAAADDYERTDADSALLYDSLLERLEG